jgi:AcrR family transcriptional regulator
MLPDIPAFANNRNRQTLCVIIGVKTMQRRKDTLVRRKQIVSAARRLIVKYGSEHVTVRRMANEIGVTEGAIYRHFKSKKDVLLLLIDDIEETLIEDVKNSDQGEVNSLEVLTKIINLHMSAIQQRKGIAFQVIAEIISLGDQKLNKKVSEVINKYIDSIQAILARGVKSGIVRSDIDLNAAAKLFFSMTQGLVNIWALHQYDFNLEKEYAPIWQVFLKGVANIDHH